MSGLSRVLIVRKVGNHAPHLFDAVVVSMFGRERAFWREDIWATLLKMP